MISDSEVIKDNGFVINYSKPIGEGGFSKVYTAQSLKDKRIVAVKVIDFQKADKVWTEKYLANEIRLMTGLNHKNIVKAIKSISTDKYAYIFMNFAAKGSVMGFIERENKPLTEEKAKKWFRDVTCGLSYLHNKDVSHRDIKPDNFLVDNNDIAMLTDFGFACIDAKSTKRLHRTSVGTVEYIAPEIRFLEAGKEYSAKPADLYSMGISLYFMVNNVYPYDSEDTDRMKEHINNRDFIYINSDLSEDVKELIYSLLNPKPNSRMTISLLETNKWLKNK